MSRKTIYYCGIPIEYNLIRKPVKNVNIRITEEGEILVSAKKGILVQEINTFVEGKAEWIIRSLAEVERYNQAKPDSEIYTGKKVYYLGKPYAVNVIENSKESVSMEEGIITITSLQTEDSDYLKEIYLAWLKNESQVVFQKILESMHKLVKKEKIPMPKFTVRNMKSRWGSCKPSEKSITLNLQLMKADEKCIEQVVLHELIHFLETGHNEKFYGYLDKYMSDWQERKTRLEEKYKDGI